MAARFREGAFASEEGFQRFLDSVQARGVMYGSNDYSRDKLEDQTIQNALKEYDRYWKYIPGSWERLDWTLKIQLNPFWRQNYMQRQEYMLRNAPKFYQPY